jgi:hypothetical protein
MFRLRQETLLILGYTLYIVTNQAMIQYLFQLIILGLHVENVEEVSSIMALLDYVNFAEMVLIQIMMLTWKKKLTQMILHPHVFLAHLVRLQ